MASSPRRAPRALAIGLLLACAVLAALWRPLVSIRTHTFAASDLVSHASSLTRTDGPWRASNSILADPSHQMHPWELFSATELREGRAPLWNPYNGVGKPHLANYQSAVFSPFSTPYYVLPFKYALLAEAFAKLLTLALGAYWLLREFELGRGPSFVGAVLLTYAGMPLLYLQYPHVGVLAAAPFALASIERIARRSASGESILGAQCVLGVSAAVAVLAGHPETLLFVAATCAFFAAWRLAEARGRRVRIGWSCAIPAFLGAGVGALQVLPFLEYLNRSVVLLNGRYTELSLEQRGWPLAFFPDLAGTPVDAQLLHASLPYGNYEGVNSFRIGAVAWLLIALAPLAAWRNRRARPLAVLAPLVGAYAYDVGGAATWLSLHTPLRHIPVLRSQPPWTIGICIAAACVLEEQRRAAPSWRAALRVLAIGVAVWGVALLGADRYLASAASQLGRDVADVRAAAAAHVAEINWAFGIALGALVVRSLFASERIRGVATACLLVACFLDQAQVHARYTPTVEDRLVYTKTPASDKLREIVGDSRTVFTTIDSLRPDANSLYGIKLLTSYDGMELYTTQRMLEELFGASPRSRFTLTGDRKALQLFGVRYVAETRRGAFAYERSAPGGIEPELDALAEAARLARRPDDPSPFFDLPVGEAVRQRFVAQHDGLDGVRLHILREPAHLDMCVRILVNDVRDKRVLADVEHQVKSLEIPLPGRFEVWTPFDAVPDAMGRTFMVSIRAKPGPSGGTVRAIRAPERESEASADDDASDANRKRRERVRLDVTYGRSDFELAGQAGRHSIYRYTASRGRAWWTSNATYVADENQALERVVDPAFEPYEEVVLLGDAQAPATIPAAYAEVERIEEDIERLSYRVHAPTRGWLVLANAWYPGWRAVVDGADRPIERADYAFSAVELPPGEHTVEFRYEPNSFALGVAISALCALTGIALVARSYLRKTRAA